MKGLVQDMTKGTILIVEDDKDISAMEGELLKSRGYTPFFAYSGTECLLLLNQRSYDLILLDLMLPGMDGEEVIGKLRQHWDVPVIAVSAKDDLESRLFLLKNGADDYIVKPFHNEELIARIEALLRRQNQNRVQNECYQFKNLIMNRELHEVKVKNIPVTLTKREYLILELLLSNPKRVFTKNNIYESVWNENYVGEENAINVHISNLRQKIGKIDSDEKYIETVWGIGFKMQTK